MPSRASNAAWMLGPLLAVALSGVMAGPAGAEGNLAASPSRFFYEEQQRAHALAPRSPVRPAATAIRRMPSRLPAPASTFRPALAAATVPRKAPTLSVAVYGDRLGQALARGLDDQAGDWLAVTNLTAEEAGLARADFVDWVQSVRARLQKADRPKVVAIMLGSNDRRPLPDGAATVEPDSPRWPSLYGARVDIVAAMFRDAHVPLVWVGLPSVHANEDSADFVRLNALFRDRASKNGAVFVDSWEAFSDDTGAYSPTGPDVDGRTVRLRKADGFGFTRAGARKLASFVEGDIKRLQAPVAPVEAPARVAEITIEKTSEFDTALDIDVNAQIRREAGLGADLASAATRAPAMPPKPAAGPVLSLTAAPLSPDGSLATASLPPSAAQQATLAVKAPEPAQASQAGRPGRADDFAWPRP